MRKITALLGAGALLLSVATPAFGIFWWPTGNRNYARVRTETEVDANTGVNEVGNYATVQNATVGLWSDVNADGNNTVRTGEADATARVGITANKNVSCGRCSSSRNYARVTTETTVSANSGYNVAGNGALVQNANLQGDITVSGNNSVTTGDASATANVFELVNVNW